MRMKKKLFISVILLAFIAVCIIGMIKWCGNSKPDPTKKYVVFENDYGDERYTLTYPGSYKVEFDYDEEKIYSFRYMAYYTDNDKFTGETGTGYFVIKANKPGRYSVSANILLGEEGYREFVLAITIKEKPDLRVMPEVRFDPNGATVEERDGKTVYVYQYDKNDHYPLIQLFYEGKEIELNLRNEGISSIIYNGDYYRYGRPYDIGSYEIKYCVGGNDYNSLDIEKYKVVYATVFVEIQ